MTGLRRARLTRGLGLNETARLAEINPAHLSRAERGMAQLSVPALARVARVLELSDLVGVLAVYTENGRP